MLKEWKYFLRPWLQEEALCLDNDIGPTWKYHIHHIPDIQDNEVVVRSVSLCDILKFSYPSTLTFFYISSLMIYNIWTYVPEYPVKNISVKNEHDFSFFLIKSFIYFVSNSFCKRLRQNNVRLSRITVEIV